jgi:membrane complex biogenesis BtpA family protein
MEPMDVIESKQRPLAPRIVGVVHLLPLPGSARGNSSADFGRVLDDARRDADAYARGGVDAIIVENFGDVPFRRGRVEPHTIAAMTLATEAVGRTCGLPIGVNVLRNDLIGAISIAAMTGARFVRANVYVGAAVTDQGIIQGEAEEAQTLVRRLGTNVDVWADVDVKHAAQLTGRPISEQAVDAIERGLAAAVIVSGTGTGRPAAMADVLAVREAVGDAAVYVGSGVTLNNIEETLRVASGVIVGSAMKVDGIVANRVDVVRVREVVAAVPSI